LRECLALAWRSRLPLTAALALVLARSVVFAWWEQPRFNSDQAIVGLMATHLAEGRAFPVFFYGQGYMLGVQAWLAAPVFLLIGPSVFALTLPLVAINVLVAALLIVLLQRDLGLGPWTALAASLFVVLPPPGTAALLLEPNGGSVEPLLYILVLWVLRRRPALFGLVLGLGVLHREFTVYGLLALLVLRAAEGRPITRQSLRHAATVAVWCAVAWLGVQGLRGLSSPFGPGTSVWDAATPDTHTQEVVSRVCWAGSVLPARIEALASRHLGVLFGTTPQSLGRLGIRSWAAGQGASWLGTLVALALAAAASRGAWLSWREPQRRSGLGFAAYLLLVGLGAMAGYAAFSCERITAATMRYDLLGLLAGVAAAAWYLRVEPARSARAAAVAVLVVWAGISAQSHARLLREYVSAPPPNGARQAVEALILDGFRYGRAPYWVAYRLTFLAGERFVLASEPPVRVRAYQRRPPGVAGPVEWIRSTPCESGRRLAEGFYRCPG
jgi:hypothetical protein